MSTVAPPITAEEKRARLKRLIQTGEIVLHPLTYPQRELFEASPVPPADVANHICCVIHIRGAIAPEDARAAIQSVVDRQDVLRLSILPGKDRPLQAVRKSGEAVFRVKELPADECDPASIERHARQVFMEPFDMVQGPLYRVEMLRCGADHHVLALAMHHLIGDGWSLGVFVEELCAAYLEIQRGHRSILPPLPQTYPVWGAAERVTWSEAEVARRVPFWRTQLDGSRLVWPESLAGPPWPLERWVSRLTPKLTTATKELARASSTTLFSCLLTAFQVALWSHVGQEDITVGSPVANRNRAAEKETMGYFAGVVPLRGKLVPNRTFAETLRAMHESIVNCLGNAMPFAEIAKAVAADPTRGFHPIFDVRFALQNHPIPDVDLPKLSAKLRMRSTGTARFHLGCELTEEDGGMEVAWLRRESVLNHDQIVELDRTFREVLEKACTTPDAELISFKQA